MQIKCHILHIFLRQTVLFCKKYAHKLSYFAIFQPSKLHKIGSNLIVDRRFRRRANKRLQKEVDRR